MINVAVGKTRWMEPLPLFDREASELEYHARVLARAADDALPLLERARFIGLFTQLTDEFFRVRVAGLTEQRTAGVKSLSRGGHTPAEQIEGLHQRFRELLSDQRAILIDQVLPALAAAGIHLRSWDDLEPETRSRLTKEFERRIKPVLTPLAVGPAHPFPFISDLSLSLGVTLADGHGPPAGAGDPGLDAVDASGPGFGRVKVPGMLDRLVPAACEDGTAMVPIEDVIGGNVDQVFPGRKVTGWHTFRVTRNADYNLESVDVDDLLEVVASEVGDRRFGHAVRLEVDTDTPDEVTSLLISELGIGEDDVFRQPRPLDLGRMTELHDLDRPDLKEPGWDGIVPPEFAGTDLFEVIHDRDVLVQVPYDSFAATTQSFIQRAADDPDVLALKQTLYRTSEDSPIVRALIRAAESDKQVAALVELKARFDEEANIRWAEELESAGVHVVFGFVDLKTHSKAALVVRRDPDGELRRYGHIATGNYNPKTAKSYEDLGLFTADPVLTEDVAEMFNMLTTNGREGRCGRLLVGPNHLKARLIELIDEQAHDQGRITIKANNLSHEEIIERLYAASQAGAEIDLIIRSICCLRPGIEGVSEGIRVRSIVGQLLEHSRIFRFGDPAGDATYLIGSADLMPRNLENRVEAMAPVDDPDLRGRLDEILDLCLRDTELAWELGPDGSWERVKAAGDPLNVQEALKSAACRRLEWLGQ
jgi:polyphosphate kinase